MRGERTARSTGPPTSSSRRAGPPATRPGGVVAVSRAPVLPGLAGRQGPLQADAIGAGWAVLQPLLTMVIFTWSSAGSRRCRRTACRISSRTRASAVDVLLQAVTRSRGSLVGNANLITKVYFPRLVVPLAAVTTPGGRFLRCRWFGLVGLMGWYRVAPTLGARPLPLFLLLAVAPRWRSGSGWRRSTSVPGRRAHDSVPHPGLAVRLAGGVPAEPVPERWRLVYGLNPMVGVIEGFRWASWHGPTPVGVIAVSVAVAVGVCVGGVVFFRRMERTFADVV